jgi:hypothetical protein
MHYYATAVLTSDKLIVFSTYWPAASSSSTDSCSSRLLFFPSLLSLSLSLHSNSCPTTAHPTVSGHVSLIMSHSDDQVSHIHNRECEPSSLQTPPVDTQCKNSDLKIILYNPFCCVVSFLFYLPLCTKGRYASHLSGESIFLFCFWVISLRVPSCFFYSSSLSFWTFLSTPTFFLSKT